VEPNKNSPPQVDSYPSHGTGTGFYTNDYNAREFKSPDETRKAHLCGADLRGANIRGLISSWCIGGTPNTTMSRKPYVAVRGYFEGSRALNWC
jgi:hypothetical protein